MTPEQIRLECLKLALESLGSGVISVDGGDGSGKDAFRTAMIFESFVREAEPFGERAPNYRYHVHGSADGKTGTPA